MADFDSVLEQEILNDLEELIEAEFEDRDIGDIERELRKRFHLSKDIPTAEKTDDNVTEEGTETENKEVFGDEGVRLKAYGHYRTRIGSPTVLEYSLSDEELEILDHNEGFPDPSTAEEIKEFDRQAFLEKSKSLEGCYAQKSRRKKRDRERSKSATAVPDFATIRLKLQKIHSPGRPKFIEHLISRVISKRVSKQANNGLTDGHDDTVDIPGEPLSPDSEKCLQQAEALVEELLTSSVRPPSGESSDSGKGSLLESTSDFSPTSRRLSLSTPSSPTLNGIVKERLKNFQSLNPSTSSDSAKSPTFLLHSPPQKQKSFKNEDFVQEVKEINKSIKQFYCSISQDKTFNDSVMASGYVKALVKKIDENKLQSESENEKKNGVDDENGSENLDLVGERLRPFSPDHDPNWNEWEKEHSNCKSVNGNKIPNGTVRTPPPILSPKPVRPVPQKPHSFHGVIGRNLNPKQEKPVNGTHSKSFSESESQEEDERPKDRLHQIAHELLTTERAYVSRLNLLDQTFHSRIISENKNGVIAPAEAVTQMFSGIKPIYQFHNDFLLPQLEQRMQNWSSEQKIGDVMAKLAPFLKIYTEYVKNYDTAMSMIEKWVSQSPKFAALLQEIQLLPECGQLTLQHHMLEPIQRVPRYELLLKDYLKRLEQNAPDRPDAQRALDLVTQAACHSNTAMKKLDKFHKLLNIIPRLNGEGTNDLVSPTRELVKEGPITKISARSGEKQARYIFLFNDLLLVCSEQMMGSYKLRARLSVEGMEIMSGDNQNIENTFCVKCIEKTVEFLDEANNGQGLDWFATFQQVVTDHQNKSKLFRVKSSEGDSSDSHPDMGSQLGLKSPQWIKDDDVTMCMACQDRFTPLKRRHHCRACGKVFCAKCSSKKAQLAYDNNQTNRVCQKCHDILKKGVVDGEDSGNGSSHKPATQTKADEASVMCGYLNVMDKDKKWTKRWITVHDDFAMYFYKKHKDVAAIQTLPLPGHNVKAIGDFNDRANVFSLTHKEVSVCCFQAESPQHFQQWVNVLEKMVKAELPTEDEKRRSSLSDSSSLSSNSTQSAQS